MCRRLCNASLWPNSLARTVTRSPGCLLQVASKYISCVFIEESHSGPFLYCNTQKWIRVLLVGLELLDKGLCVSICVRVCVFFFFKGAFPCVRLCTVFRFKEPRPGATSPFSFLDSVSLATHSPLFPSHKHTLLHTTTSTTTTDSGFDWGGTFL